MRILFDGYWWHDGPLANRSVQRDLITTWCELFPRDEVFVTTRVKPTPENRAAQPPTPTELVRLWPHALSNLVELPLIARRLKVDLALVHNYTPLLGRSATFVHDVMFVEHPEWFSRQELVYFWPMLPTARRAVAVFTSTRTEAARMQRRARGSFPVTAIGLAVPRGLAEATPTRPPTSPEAGTFSLCVGRLNIRKNLAAVLRGALGSKSVTPQTPLLIVGSAEHSGRDAVIPAEFQSAVQSGAIVFLGRISDAELAWLYSNTAAVIYLSLDEGFGLPPIEAAHFGAPVVASDIPVFRETVGDYADLVDPIGPIPDISAAIDRAWGDRPDQNRGAAVLAKYNWPQAVTTMRASILSSLAR